MAALLILLTIVRVYRRSLWHIRALALTDPLTGGSNFQRFQMAGVQLLRERPARNYAIVYLNIKNFKRFNERFGVKYGDELLKQVHDSLKSCLTPKEPIARASGDHFFLMLACADEESVRRRMAEILDRLTAQLSDSFALSRENFYQGAYLVQDTNADFIVLTDRAKLACAYSRGKDDCGFYDDSLSRKLEREHKLDSSFHSALARHEFQLYIQPKVCPGHSQAAGGEVLVRWQHPEYGLLFPGDFIPLFERNGKICDLDFYMFEEACKLLQSWLAEGTAIPLSVNLSRAHLVANNLSFLNRFQAIKEQYGIPDGLVELELTESIMLERRDLRLVITMIDRIREMGFLCSIDDFGFGYSSLSLLKDLNVTTVKLDRQFFLSESAKSWRVVDHLIQLAHSLDMTVVAEGIEDSRQVEQLRRQGCDLIQGYVYAKPMPIAEIYSWSAPEICLAPQLSIEPSVSGLPQAAHAALLPSGETNEYKRRLALALKAANICVYEVDLTRQRYTFFENAESIFGVSGEKILADVSAFSALSP